jgi:hypothetical protein
VLKGVGFFLAWFLLRAGTPAFPARRWLGVRASRSHLERGALFRTNRLQPLTRLNRLEVFLCDTLESQGLCG